MNQKLAPSGRNPVHTRSRYCESEPDITSTGIGKNYNGYRIFYDSKTDTTVYIGEDYTRRDPNETEFLLFKMQLTESAGTNPAIAERLKLYPWLIFGGPLAEGPATQLPQPKHDVQPAAKKDGGQ